MAWRIVGGPEAHARSGVDAQGWIWDLEHENGERRRPLVEIARTALAVEGGLADDTTEAIASQGRSEIEKVLGEDDPPRVILCTTQGCAPRGDI